jgi:hypothetical protein
VSWPVILSRVKSTSVTVSVGSGVIAPSGRARRPKYYALCPTDGLDTKAAAAARALPENKGKLLVTEDLLTTAWRIRREGIETNDDAIACLNSPDGMKEATLICWDPLNRCRRKIRVDYLPMKGQSFGNCMVDIKTTRKELFDFPKEAKYMGYILSAAYYLDTHEMATGHRMDHYKWLVVTNEEPYMSRVFYMRNLLPSDPLYNGSQLQQARERLGLDNSGKLGRLTQFLSCLREHEVARREGQTLNFAALRNIWPAYEQTEAVEILV